MKLEELKEQYSQVPVELQQMKRWVGYKVEKRDGKDTKVPYNAITGDKAQSNNNKTWTSFKVAINGVFKYELDGLGFMLGNGIFGIDLDNHPNADGVYDMNEDEFNEFSQEFIKQLDSYTERSRSGKGIHIICQGSLPEGRRRKGCVEMYDYGRFFAFTGDVICAKPVNERTKEVVPLWEKYVDDSKEIEQMRSTKPLSVTFGQGNNMTDQETVEKAKTSQNDGDFERLFNGDMSAYHDDHSSADLAFCSQLAFWCNGDKDQMDRIFRSSGLMREKWDAVRGKDTYGNITLDKAIATMTDGYVKQTIIPEVMPTIVKNKVFKSDSDAMPDNFMTIGEDGEPIFKIKPIYKKYPYTDTGNAERFYDYFGEYFRWNVSLKCFMYWTGDVWKVDSKEIIRKYVNKLIDIQEAEIKRMEQEKSEALKNGENDKATFLKSELNKAYSNLNKISNRSGKDSLLNEFSKIHEIPVSQEEFDIDEFAINTKSGLVNLKTGIITPHNKKQRLSKITNCKVSYDEPVEWIKFLNGVFYRGTTPKDFNDTKEIIECFQMALGLTLSGSTREQVMFLLYGDGSNGKSTLIEELAYIMGDYSQPIDSNMLMSKNQTSQSVQFSLAELPGCRFLVTKETNEYERLDEAVVKAVTGGDQINAQFKGGKLFHYQPQFKLWMMTNNLPIIRGGDYGIWRRIFLVPFEHQFTEEEKDMDMPIKLRAESPQILGWAIKGFLKYVEGGMVLKRPNCLKQATENYKSDMDVTLRFINRWCVVSDSGVIERQALYDAFVSYSQKNNEFPLPEPKFNKSMNAKGFISKKEANGEEYYRGIRLIPSYMNKVQDGGESAHKTLFKK